MSERKIIIQYKIEGFNIILYLNKIYFKKTNMLFDQHHMMKLADHKSTINKRMIMTSIDEYMQDVYINSIRRATN
jgi:hypothetical protein